MSILRYFFDDLLYYYNKKGHDTLLRIWGIFWTYAFIEGCCYAESKQMSPMQGS